MDAHFIFLNFVAFKSVTYQGQFLR